MLIARKVMNTSLTFMTHWNGRTDSQLWPLTLLLCVAKRSKRSKTWKKKQSLILCFSFSLSLLFFYSLIQSHETAGILAERIQFRVHRHSPDRWWIGHLWEFKAIWWYYQHDWGWTGENGTLLLLQMVAGNIYIIPISSFF